MPKNKKGGSYSSPKGLYSYRSNPMGTGKMNNPRTGPALGTPVNSDQVKAGKLRARAYAEKDSLRGKNGI